MKKKNSLPSLTTVKPFALRLGTLQFLFQCFLIICATVHGLASEYISTSSIVSRSRNTEGKTKSFLQGPLPGTSENCILLGKMYGWGPPVTLEKSLEHTLQKVLNFSFLSLSLFLLICFCLCCSLVFVSSCLKETFTSTVNVWNAMDPTGSLWHNNSTWKKLFF